MPIIRNQAQLMRELNLALREVIDEVSGEVRETLVRYIQEATYRNDYFPNFEYENGDGSAGSGQPSFEFEQSFRWRGIKQGINGITNELYNAWEQMTVDRVTGRHYENGEDIRKKLAAMMNVRGIVGHKKREPYFDLFLTEMDRRIDDLFIDALRRRGFNVT